VVETAGAHRDVLIYSPPALWFKGFGDSAPQFELLVHRADITQRLVVSRELYFALNKAFRREGIVVPFPQCDRHLPGMEDRLQERTTPRRTGKAQQKKWRL